MEATSEKVKHEIILVGAGDEAGLISRAILGSMPNLKVLIVDEPPQVERIKNIAKELPLRYMGCVQVSGKGSRRLRRKNERKNKSKKK